MEADPDQLRSHASHVHDDAYELNRASLAAITVSVDGTAFGQLISFVGTWFQEQEAELRDAYMSAVTTLHEDASAVTTTADDYERSDRAAADRLTAPAIELPL